MNTQKLIPCPKCGHSISSYAERCPKCSTWVFKCRICEKHGSYETDTRYNVYSYGNQHYHVSCLASYFRFPDNIRCPECQKSLKNSGIDDFASLGGPRQACPYCGYPYPLQVRSSCEGCGLGIYEFQRYISNKNECDDRCYHYFCGAQLREALLAKGWVECCPVPHRER